MDAKPLWHGWSSILKGNSNYLTVQNLLSMMIFVDWIFLFVYETKTSWAMDNFRPPTILVWSSKQTQIFLTKVHFFPQPSFNDTFPSRFFEGNVSTVMMKRAPYLLLWPPQVLSCALCASSLTIESNICIYGAPIRWF